MAIKPGEYIQLLNFFSLNPNFIDCYHIENNIELWDTYRRFDELREVHLKYKKECDTYCVYRNLDLTNMNLYKQDIITICKEFKINVTFLEYQNIEYKKGIHCFYNYHGKTRSYNITELIILYKEMKKSSVAKMEHE